MRKRRPGCRTAKSVSGFCVERSERRMAEAVAANEVNDEEHKQGAANHDSDGDLQTELQVVEIRDLADRKSTRLNSSHGYISYAVFCLKKKKRKHKESEPAYPVPTQLHLDLAPTTFRTL